MVRYLGGIVGMRSIEEIRNSGKVVIDHLCVDGGMGFIKIGRWKGSVIWSYGGGWEHVSVCPMESDSTLIGMNVSETSLLNIFLENRKMKKMTMSPKSNGTLYPMLQRPPEKMKLDNFAWLDYIRPLNKEDIFLWRGKKAGQELKKSNRSAVPLPNHNLFNKKK